MTLVFFSYYLKNEFEKVRPVTTQQLLSRTLVEPISIITSNQDKFCRKYYYFNHIQMPLMNLSD